MTEKVIHKLAKWLFILGGGLGMIALLLIFVRGAG
ncbi:hypothetical protein HNR40_005069 [Nonomuraea endophytica]|uniref:Uncharacterized protein n=1 Tax=Nonomuraea endophytica TaxID=714136 RepID=A0A7W8EHI7_9ACTN|nr:hypothetical protein [Nonomuraea endophytica]